MKPQLERCHVDEVTVEACVFMKNMFVHNIVEFHNTMDNF